MTSCKMRLAGNVSEQIEFSDEDLALAIEGTKLTLEFLEGKGIRWHLAISKLRLELNMFEGYQFQRTIHKA